MPRHPGYVVSDETRRRIAEKKRRPYLPIEVSDQGYSSPCWLWVGARFKTGYGALTRQRKVWRAHRWMYEQYIGMIPDGLHLDHLCGVKHCVNPIHLEPVPKRENERRYHASAPRKAECGRGHPRVAPNLLKSGACRLCNLEHQRAYKARRRQQPPA